VAAENDCLGAASSGEFVTFDQGSLRPLRTARADAGL
jgi:hypothetical protein